MSIYASDARVQGLSQSIGQDMRTVLPNVRKINTAATREPLATDDETQGFAPGSRWQYEGREYVALATDAGLARWVITTAINPMMFGARGDGVTDDTAALNAMFDYARSTTFAAALIRPVVIDGRGRTYCTFGSVNATMLINNKGMAIRDFYITSRAGGKVAVDFSGARWFDLENVHIYGQGQTDATRRPWSGLLLQRADGASPASNFTLRNVTVDGYFTGAALHNYAAEMVNAESCYFWNRNAPSGSSDPGAADYAPAYGAVLDGRGIIPTKSEFVVGVSGKQSFTVNNYVSCAFQKPFAAQGPAMYLSDCNSIKFIKPYITNGGPGAVIDWRVWSDFATYGIDFDGLQVETDGNKSVFNFVTGGAVAGFSVYGLDVSFGNIFSTEDVFRTDAVAGAVVRLRDSNLRIRRWNSTSPTNGVFAPRGRFGIAGNVTVPAASDLGTMTEYQDFTATVTDLAANRRDTWGRSYLRGGATVYGSMDTSGWPVYADNAAAVAAGAPVGRAYKTATGDLRVVV